MSIASLHNVFYQCMKIHIDTVSSSEDVARQKLIYSHAFMHLFICFFVKNFSRKKLWITLYCTKYLILMHFENSSY